MRDFDPPASLDGGDDGLDFFRRLAKDFDRLSTPEGRCFVQIGPRYATLAARIFRNAGFKNVGTLANYLGEPCCLSVGKNGSASWIERIKCKIKTLASTLYPR